MTKGRDGNKFVKRGEILEVKIQDYAFGGKGIAKIENEHGASIVFVPNSLPGQLVKVQIQKAKKTYAESKLLEVIERAEDEVDFSLPRDTGCSLHQVAN